MEDNLNFKFNGKRPQFLGKWKTTQRFRLMEDNHSFQLAQDSPEPGTAQPQLVYLTFKNLKIQEIHKFKRFRI